jgi:predicted nuclease of predicted toxin-antitoxin system
MKVKLDENLPARLAVALRSRGHDVDTVPDEGLQGRADSDVWHAAQREERFLITQDLDFSDVRRFRPGMHAGLLLVRLNAPGRQALLRRIDALFAAEPVEQWQRCFVVVTEHKIRVRGAPKS